MSLQQEARNITDGEALRRGPPVLKRYVAGRKRTISNMSNTTVRAQSNLITALFLILVILGAGLSYYRAFTQLPTIPVQTIISQQTLEEQYGVHVNLLAVTAAGGMIDLRLKIVDGEKAKALLKSKADFPALYVRDVDNTLKASADDQSQPYQLVDNANMFVLYPNAANAVKPGTAVNILFGDIAVEALEAK